MIYEKCKTCKYFVQYYIKQGLHFRPIIERCRNENILKKTRRFNNIIENCQYWEKAPDTNEKTKKSVEKAVSEINESLHEILEILNLDKEE